MGSDNTAVKQDGFNSQIGFIIACVGSAVGMEMSHWQCMTEGNL